MALVYVMGYLFVSSGCAANSWLWIEILSVPIFASLAVLGVKRSPWFLAVGIRCPRIRLDSWHYRNSAYMPDWYVIACLAGLHLGSVCGCANSRVPERVSNSKGKQDCE
jgi:hypothetical protein